MKRLEWIVNVVIKLLPTELMNQRMNFRKSDSKVQKKGDYFTKIKSNNNLRISSASTVRQKAWRRLCSTFLLWWTCWLWGELPGKRQDGEQTLWLSVVRTQPDVDCCTVGSVKQLVSLLLADSCRLRRGLPQATEETRHHVICGLDAFRGGQHNACFSFILEFILQLFTQSPILPDAAWPSKGALPRRAQKKGRWAKAKNQDERWRDKREEERWHVL